MTDEPAPAAQPAVQANRATPGPTAAASHGLRRFNDDGVEQFRQNLAQLGQDPTLPPPSELLDASALTEAVPGARALTRPGFATKCQAAEYLSHLLKPVQGPDLFQDVGLWSWLTLFYFDDVCPSKQGKRAPLQRAHYVPEPWDHRRFYMHLLASSLRILQLAPVHNCLFLEYPPHVRSEVMQAMMSRLYLMRIPCIPEAIETLYYDPTRRRPKVRALNPKQKRPQVT